MDNKYEHLKFIIQRFDHFYDTVNSKVAFYIGLNTFVLGAIGAGYTCLPKPLRADWWVWGIMFIAVLSSILSTLFTIAAINPYKVDNHNHSPCYSLLFFDSIAKHELSHLKDKFHRQSQDDITNDALEQMHSLAIGLSKKFACLSRATICLKLQVISLVPLLIYFIIKN